MAYSKNLKCVAFAISFVVMLSLTPPPACGGLQDAINAMYDSYESLEFPRDFLAPILGNDVFGPSTELFLNNKVRAFSDGPQLLYEPSSGGLTAIIPAAVIDIGREGVPNYVKLYSLADVSIDSRQLHGSWSLPTSTSLAWGLTGPLAAVPATDALTITQDQITWRTTAVFGGTTGLYGEPLESKIVAAVVNLGLVLPRGLTFQELEQSIFPGQSLNYVEYYNHRGVVTFTVPLTLGIVPEPTTFAELVSACALILARRRQRRPSIRCRRIV